MPVKNEEVFMSTQHQLVVISATWVTFKIFAFVTSTSSFEPQNWQLDPIVIAKNFLWTSQYLKSHIF